jgi:hypothetical protein
MAEREQLIVFFFNGESIKEFGNAEIITPLTQPVLLQLY